LQAALGPLAVQVDILTDRTTTISRVRSRTCSFTAGADRIALVVMVIFSFPPQYPGHHHSPASPFRFSSLIGQLFRRMLYLFSATASTNLSLIGADHFDGLCRRRRHRHDRKTISRYKSRKAKSPLQAALKGSEQNLVFTIVSLTVSLIAVLIPTSFLWVISLGRLFREFARHAGGHHLGLRVCFA